ncbi:hypothetical protein [Evansella tamaricis]|uniref:Uncharacterized protein n=1 Tax=Evansella tamaricis TaxID=2069301 RepID=A0ABS6JF00_9BACI|nr:hypothetical protein [Evansella tamaricis]MBU9711035.1 hypothetical protein [Evansella tamaricis]
MENEVFYITYEEKDSGVGITIFESVVFALDAAADGHVFFGGVETTESNLETATQYVLYMLSE